MRYPRYYSAICFLKFKKVCVMKKYVLSAGLLACCVFSASLTHASSAQSLQFAANIANVCPGAWDSPACLTAVSESNFVMVSNYGAVLQQAKLEAQAESLKQNCAASTAHREQAFPAAAMRSAFVACANHISDLVDQTKVSPDTDHFQLLVAPVLCMDKNKSCAQIEAGLLQYKGR